MKFKNRNFAMLKAIWLHICNNKKNTYLFLTLTFFAVQFLLYQRFGIVTTNEAAKYIKQGTLLYETGGFSDAKYIFYLPVILLVYLCKLLGIGYGWVVLCQVLLSWVAMLCFYHLVKANTNSSLGVLGALLLTFFIPLQSWNFHLYTDSVFISLITIYLYIIFKYQNKGIPGSLIILLFLLMLQFVRPNAVLLILPTILFLIFKKQSKNEKMLNIAFSTFSIALMYFVAKYAFMGGGDLDTLKPFIEEHIICFVPLKPNGANIDIIRSGNPIYDLFYYIIHNKVHFLKLMFLKLFSFFKLTRPFYSPLHNTLLLSFIIPLYILAISGLRKISIKENFSVFLMSFLILYPIGISLQCDDWHSRFTMVVIPGIILLAMLGLKVVFKQTTEKKLL